MHQLITEVRSKNLVISIGILHLILITYGAYATICDVIQEEEPVTPAEVFYIMGHVLLQVILAAFLIVGGLTRNPWLVLPWLVTTTPVFTLATVYSALYSDMLEFPTVFFYNAFMLVCFWTMWYVVFKFHCTCKRHTTSTQDSVRYSELSRDL